MNESVIRLLKAWPNVWTAPDLWAAIHDHVSRVESQRLLLALLRARIFVPGPVQSFDELATTGRFSAAEALLGIREMSEQLSESQIRGLERRLEASRIERRQAIESRTFVLRQRIRRLGSRAPEFKEHFQDAAMLVHDRADEADAMLELVESEVLQIERELKKGISNKMELTVSRAADPVAAVRWRSAIEACLSAGDWQTAERWVRDGISAAAKVQAKATRRLPWPAYPWSTRQILTWFRKRDDQVPRPPSFDREWGVESGDAVGEFLLQRLEDLEQSLPALGLRVVGNFVDALEQVLERHEEGDRSLETASVPLPSGDGLAIGTRLRGVAWPGLYAFTEHGYANGIPLVVTAPIIDDSGRDEAVERDGEQEVRALAFDSKVVVVYGPRPMDRISESIIELTPEDVFRLIGDRSARRINLIRTFAGGLSLRFALPEPIPQPAGDFVVGRDSILELCRTSSRPVLITGAPAIGRTAVLRAHARALGVHAVVRDDLHLLEPSQVVASIVALGSEHGANKRVVASCSAEFAWLHQNAFDGWHVEALTRLEWQDASSMVVALCDPIGIEFDTPDVLDRLVYSSGGHPGLIHTLLWEICQRMDVGGGRAAGVTSDVLASALKGEEYLGQGRRLLIQPLASHPALQMALAALLLEQAGDRRDTTIDELIQWAAMAGVGVTSTQATLALSRLASCGLCDQLDGRWWLNATGVGSLVLDLVGDPFPFLEAASSRCSKLPDGTLLEL